MTKEATVRKSPQVSENSLPEIISGQSKQVSGNTPTHPPLRGGGLEGEFPDAIAPLTPKNEQPEFPDEFPDASKELVFFVPMKPVAQSRPRACVRKNGRAGSYDDGKTANWKAAVAWCAKEAMSEFGWPKAEGAVRVTMVFSMPRPKGHTRKDGTLKPSAPAYMTPKPDLENLEKGTLDAMTIAGAWRDDSLVVEKITLKRWADSSQISGCSIQVETLYPAPRQPWKSDAA